MEAKPILGYWHIRGLGEAIRYLLRYLGVDFEDRTYVQGPKPECDRSAWFDSRDSLGLDFPNLPYFIDGDIKISESLAILRYIALKYNESLNGTTAYEKAKVNELAGVLYDVKMYISMTCYNADFFETLPKVLENTSHEVEGIAKFLGDKQFLVGDNLTWPDFMLFELLEMIEAIKPGKVAEINGKLVEYRNRIANLPHIPEMLAQPRLPFSNTQATWS